MSRTHGPRAIGWFFVALLVPLVALWLVFLANAFGSSSDTDVWDWLLPVGLLTPVIVGLAYLARASLRRGDGPDPTR